MSEHRVAFVPTTVSWYSSPDLMARGIEADIGLLLEALIYYDSVLLNAGTGPGLANLVKCFVERDALPELESLLSGGEIILYDYSFLFLTRLELQFVDVVKVVDPVFEEPSSFSKRVLRNPQFVAAFPTPADYERFCGVVDGRVIEVKSDRFPDIAQIARSDYADPQRNALIHQLLVNEAYTIGGLSRPPKVATRTRMLDNGFLRVEWDNLDFRRLADLLGVTGTITPVKPKGQEVQVVLGPHDLVRGYPVTAIAQSTMYIASAMQEGVDLYLPRPLSSLTGDKLYEASREPMSKPKAVIEQLEETVEFPDTRHLLNSRELTPREVLAIRDKAQKFRTWLQDEAERDRDALVAYHKEVACEAGYTRNVAKTIRMFGRLGCTTLGAAAGYLVSADPLTAKLVGASFGSVAGVFLDSIAKKLSADWKPVVFGDWYKEHITRILNERDLRLDAGNPIGLSRAKRRHNEKKRRHLERKNREPR